MKWLASTAREKKTSAEYGPTFHQSQCNSLPAGLRVNGGAVLLLSGGASVKYDGHYNQGHAESEESQIAFQSSLRDFHPEVVEHSEHQGETAAEREGDRHPGNRSRSAEKDVGGIEYEAAHDEPKHRGTGRLRNVLKERPAGRTERT